VHAFWHIIYFYIILVETLTWGGLTPGGATALIAVIGGENNHNPGFQFSVITAYNLGFDAVTTNLKNLGSNEHGMFRQIMLHSRCL
jgi:hypothetical protein